MIICYYCYIKSARKALNKSDHTMQFIQRLHKTVCVAGRPRPLAISTDNVPSSPQRSVTNWQIQLLQRKLFYYSCKKQLTKTKWKNTWQKNGWQKRSSGLNELPLIDWEVMIIILIKPTHNRKTIQVYDNKQLHDILSCKRATEDFSVFTDTKNEACGQRRSTWNPVASDKIRDTRIFVHFLTTRAKIDTMNQN